MNQESKWIATWGKTTDLGGEMSRLENEGMNQPRHAFVGRSNVGKSSLINALLKKTLAKVSSTPGKTRLLHLYHSPYLERVLVDLPGYGFAKVSRSEVADWEQLIANYLKLDRRLDRLWILWDARHGPTANDLEAFDFFRRLAIPASVVMTKYDQVKTQKERAARLKEVNQILPKIGLNAKDVLWVSMKSNDGIADLFRKLRNET